MKSVKITLELGSTYEVIGVNGKKVKFKFLHANNGNPVIEIDGVAREVDSICNLVNPDDFQSLSKVA